MEGFTWCGTKTGRNYCKPASFLWPRFHRLPGWTLNCFKIVYGDSALKKNAKIKMTGSITGPAGKKKYRLDYWSGHGRTNRTVCYGPAHVAQIFSKAGLYVGEHGES